jgi:hypothetical protein
MAKSTPTNARPVEHSELSDQLTEYRELITALQRENTYLRESAEAFGQLAERLNAELQAVREHAPLQGNVRSNRPRD